MNTTAGTSLRRLVVVLGDSAMRHFRDTLLVRGIRVGYLSLEEHAHASLAQALPAATITPAAIRSPRTRIMMSPAGAAGG